MLNKALQKELEKGLPSPVYFLSSDESCFLDDALAKCIETVIASHPADFNYDMFDSAAGINEILNTASTLPFMAPRRLVVLRDFHQFPGSAVKALMSYFKEPADTTCLVILSAKAPKAAWKAGWKAFSLNIRDWDMPAWLKQAALNRGVKLTGEAVDCLIEYVGYDAGLLSMEIEKLALSGKTAVNGKDVMSSVSMMREYTAFDLLDSLVGGQKTRAFRILKNMNEGGPHEAPLILGTLNWHYKQFYSLWKHSGARPARMREKTYRMLMKHLPRYNESDFCDVFGMLHQADIGIKSSGRPELTMEILLIKLLQRGAVN
jgi:DNA polymerase-3 subunit delta